MGSELAQIRYRMVFHVGMTSWVNSSQVSLVIRKRLLNSSGKYSGKKVLWTRKVYILFKFLRLQQLAMLKIIKSSSVLDILSYSTSGSSINSSKRMFSLFLLVLFSRETSKVMTWDGLVHPTWKYTVPFVTWKTRNFKPEFLVRWKAPSNSKECNIRFDPSTHLYRSWKAERSREESSVTEHYFMFECNWKKKKLSW